MTTVSRFGSALARHALTEPRELFVACAWK